LPCCILKKLQIFWPLPEYYTLNNRTLTSSKIGKCHAMSYFHKPSREAVILKADFHRNFIFTNTSFFFFFFFFIVDICNFVIGNYHVLRTATFFNFTNILRATFTGKDSKSAKQTLFCILGSSRI